MEKLIVEGKPTFGVLEHVGDVNYLDYPSYRLKQKPLPTWRRWLGANQFCFVQILTPDVQVCASVASIKFATTAFCYVYDRETERIIDVDVTTPLTIGSELTTSPHSGRMQLESRALTVDLDLHKDHYNLNINGEWINLSATCHRTVLPLVVCSPTGRHGWVFTQKEPSYEVTGRLELSGEAGNRSVDLAAVPTLGALDWTLGYMREITTWFWTSISTSLEDGRHFAMNLATGVNESGTSENACWIDGERHYLPPVLFERDRRHPRTAWRVHHQQLGWSNVELDVTFEPITSYEKDVRAVIVDSVFQQWIGRYTGRIVVNGETIELCNVLGIAEDHYAKW